MSAQVTPILANPDPSDNPTTLGALITLLNTLFEAVNVTGGPFTPYVISSTTPAVGDQDKAWLKVDGNGRPLAIYLYYSGNWRRFYSGKIGEITIFSGNPATYFSSGLGIVGGEWDGFALCDGTNGTPNLSNLFIVGGAMDNAGITGYSGGSWKTSVSGGSLATGGQSGYTIKNTDLPNLTVQVTGAHYSSGAATGIQRTLVDGDHSAGDHTDLNPIASYGQTAGTAQTLIPNVPPFLAMGYAMFVGY